MIKKWISRLLGGQEEGSAQPPAGTTQSAAAAGDAAPGSLQQRGELEAAFYHWITGETESAVASHVERIILEKLEQLAANPANGARLVPRVPAVIPQLLKSLRDDSSSGADLAKQLAQDPVLVAEVIRESNSSYYAPTSTVKNIEGAIMLLGQNGMRMLLARVSFRPIITQQSGVFSSRVAPLVWSQSEKCALAGSMLAPSMRAGAFEAYLAGLMQNVGLIASFRLVDQVYKGDEMPQSDEFIEGLLLNARKLSAGIARQWEFPANVVEAIELAGAPSEDPLARALAAADRIAKLRMLADAGRVDMDLAQTGMDAAAKRCFDKLAEQETE